MKIRIKPAVIQVNGDDDDVSVDTTLSPADQIAEQKRQLKEMELEEKRLTAQIKGVTIEPKKITAKKPALKKATSTGKESSLSNRIDTSLKPSAEMKLKHEQWVADVAKEFSGSYKLDVQEEVDRIDITDKDETDYTWRLCIVGMIGGDIDATLFFKGKPDRMQPSICFLNIPATQAVFIVQDLLTMKHTYSFGAK